MSATTLVLDAALDPGRAEVVVQRGPTLRAAFRLSGMPRVESLLIGRPVRAVPALVERLCGICPASHHLAGARALEALLGIDESGLPAGAVAVRRLLHHASVLGAHAQRLAWVDGDLAGSLRQVARTAEQAAGGPGHFPVCAVPGGVRALVDPAVAGQLLVGVEAALPRLVTAVDRLLDGEAESTAARLPRWEGVDVALVGESEAPDLLGTRLRVVDADGRVLATAPPSGWADLVTEAVPGSAAPRPYVTALGCEVGRIRVGPVSQLTVGPLATPTARAAQGRWLHGPRTAAVARAIIALHCAEVLAALAATPALTGGPSGPEATGIDGGTTSAGAGPRVGTGWIDGQRGLLSHSYGADATGLLVAAQVLTPTASNEAWLADLLTVVVRSGGKDTTEPPTTAALLEAAIREADPCLPCTSTPPGAMAVTICEGA